MANPRTKRISPGQKTAIIVLNAESAAAGNVSGFFESLGVDRAISAVSDKASSLALLNEAIMDSSGYSPSCWESFNADWLSSPKVSQYVAKAMKVLESEFEDSHLMLIDDVGMARLVPFWNIVFEKMKVVPRYVFVVEDPAELAEEFSERLDREPRHSHLIWLRTALDAEVHSRGRLRTFLDPIALGEQPVTIMEKAAQTLDLVFPRKIRATAASNPACLAALRTRALRAAQTDSFDAERAAPSDWVKVAHMTLGQWAAEGETDEGKYMLDAVREAFDDAVPAFQGVGEVAPGLSRQLRELEGKLETLKHELDEARGELGDARAEIAIARAAEVSAHKQVEESDAAARKQQADLKQRIAHLESELAQNDDFARQQQSVAKHRIADLESALTENEADSRRQHADLSHRIGYLESELAQRKAEVDDSERALQDARRQVAVLGQEMAALREVARHDVDMLHQAIREANQARDETEEQLQERYREIVTLSRKLAMEAAAAETLKRRTERLKRIALTFEAGGARGRFANLLDMIMPWRWHLARIRRRMEKGGAFDGEAYLAANPDVAQAGMDPLKHYLAHGLDENRPLGTH